MISELNKGLEKTNKLIKRDNKNEEEKIDYIPLYSNKNEEEVSFIIESEKDYINYNKYLNLVSKSKCILDFNINEQIGLSLRPLEALFFEKKLITNNSDIVNYSFYDKNNIFVIGIDEYKDIKDFLNKPYNKIDKKIINYYDYKEWIKRFEEENEF